MDDADRSVTAIVGAGALGQTLAAYLAASRQPVTILATPGTATRLLTEKHIHLRGATVLDVGVSAAPGAPGTVGVTTDASRLPGGGGLVFATKAHQLREAIRQVRAGARTSSPRVRWVAGLQNGIVKDDLLRDGFGSQSVVGAATTIGARREADGCVRVSGIGPTYLGALEDGVTENVNAAANTFRRAGLPVVVTSNILGVLWAKACNAASVFGVSVLSRTSSSAMMSNADLVRAYLSLLRESAAVVSALGVDLLDYGSVSVRARLEFTGEEAIKAIVAREIAAHAVATGPEEYPSMTQDLLAGRGLEVDEVIGNLVERADRAGISVPRLALIRDLIRGIDPGRRQS